VPRGRVGPHPQPVYFDHGVQSVDDHEAAHHIREHNGESPASRVATSEDNRPCRLSTSARNSATSLSSRRQNMPMTASVLICTNTHLYQTYAAESPREALAYWLWWGR